MYQSTPDASVLRTILCAAVIVVVALLGAVTTAHAQSPKGPLVLLAEERFAPEGELEAGFWWSSSQAPAWTPTDLALMEAGVALHRPDDLGSISRIYRRANLSDANAITLAGLFGRGEVVVGTVRVEAFAGAPMGLQGVQVSVDARAVRASGEGPRVSERLDVRRVAFGASVEEASTAARRAAAEALAHRLRAMRAGRGGEVGIATDEPLIAIRDARTGLVLEAIQNYLRGLEGVTGVETRWAAAGVVALEINPGVADPPAQVRRWASALESQLFESFTAHRRSDASGEAGASAGLVELQVRHTETALP